MSNKEKMKRIDVSCKLIIMPLIVVIDPCAHYWYKVINFALLQPILILILIKSINQLGKSLSHLNKSQCSKP